MYMAIQRGRLAVLHGARHVIVVALGVALLLNGTRISAADEPGDLPKTFSDLTVLVNNLNLLEPFADPQQINELNKLVSQLQETQAQGEKADPARLKAVAEELASKLDARRTEFLASLEDTGEALSGEMKESLQAACKGASQQSLKQLLVAATDKNKPREAIEALIRDRFAPDRECRAALNLAAKQLAADIKVLDSRLAELDSEIRAAEAKMLTASEQERKELGKEIDKKKAEKKEIEQKRAEKVKVKGKIDWGLILSGIANIAVGAALTVFTAGWGVVLGEALIQGGLGFIGAGLLPLTESKEEIVERSDKVLVRPDVVEDGKPSPENAEKVKQTLQQQGLTPISVGSGGNFLVVAAPDGYWQVIQIDPHLIVMTITPAIVEPSPNEKGVTGLASISGPVVTKIDGARTRLVIDFDATAPNGPVKGRLTEAPGLEEKFLLTVE